MLTEPIRWIKLRPIENSLVRDVEKFFFKVTRKTSKIFHLTPAASQGLPRSKNERNIQPLFYSNHDSSACHDEIGIKNRTKFACRVEKYLEHFFSDAMRRKFKNCELFGWAEEGGES